MHFDKRKPRGWQLDRSALPLLRCSTLRWSQHVFCSNQVTWNVGQRKVVRANTVWRKQTETVKNASPCLKKRVPRLLLPLLQRQWALLGGPRPPFPGCYATPVRWLSADGTWLTCQQTNEERAKLSIIDTVFHAVPRDRGSCAAVERKCWR